MSGRLFGLILAFLATWTYGQISYMQGRMSRDHEVELATADFGTALEMASSK